MPQKGVTSNPTPLVKRRHVIGVMGSGRDPHAAMSVPLGAWLATTGCHIITGGGRGCMEMVSKSFSEVRDRRGMIIGIIPSLPVGRGDDAVNPPPGYPNPYVELVIRTHLPLSARPSSGTEATSRNHINILSSDVVIALPGSSGTWSEVQLAYRYRKPLILFLGEGGKEVEIPSDEDMGDFKIAQTLEEVKAFVTEALEKLDKAAEMRVVSPPLPMTLHNSLSESAPIIPLSTQLSNGSVGGGRSSSAASSSFDGTTTAAGEANGGSTSGSTSTSSTTATRVVSSGDIATSSDCTTAPGGVSSSNTAPPSLATLKEEEVAGGSSSDTTTTTGEGSSGIGTSTTATTAPSAATNTKVEVVEEGGESNDPAAL